MDKKLLEKKFKSFAPLVEAVYEDALKYAPTEREHLDDTISNTKFRFRDLQNRVAGEVTRFDLKGEKRYNSINIDIKEHEAKLDLKNSPEWYKFLEPANPSSADLTAINSNAEFEYKRQRAFAHEMIHAIAKVKFFPFSASAYPYKIIPKFEDNGHTICKILGNTDIYFFRDNVEYNSLFANDFASRLIEEGVVEEWAMDLASRMDPSQFHQPSAYDWSVYLVGMWNAVSNNQLRREHILGASEDTHVSHATQEFKNLLHGYLSTVLNPENEKNLPELNSQNFDLTTHMDSIKDLIKFCDHYFLSQKLAKINEDKAKYYLNCRKVVMGGTPTCELMNNYLDSKFNLKNKSKVQTAYLRTFSRSKYDLTKLRRKKLEDFLKYGPIKHDAEEILKR